MLVVDYDTTWNCNVIDFAVGDRHQTRPLSPRTLETPPYSALAESGRQEAAE
jgi:hypothetical protein